MLRDETWILDLQTHKRILLFQLCFIRKTIKWNKKSINTLHSAVTQVHSLIYLPGNIQSLIIIVCCTKLSSLQPIFIHKEVSACLCCCHKTRKRKWKCKQIAFPAKNSSVNKFCQLIPDKLYKSWTNATDKFIARISVFFTIDRFPWMFWLFFWWSVIGLEKWVYI